jgi:RNA polymerase sigma-70 factor (sigma-E family)
VTFEQYATTRLTALLGTARAICGDPALAEDLVQDVLIKVHAHWDGIEALAARDAYVRRMLVNELISWRRKWARMVPHAQPTRDLAGPDEASAHAERDELLAEIRRLPPRQRVVIGLRYFADQSDEQIAEALGCAQGTVRVHASRALAALRVSAEPVRIRTEH